MDNGLICCTVHGAIQLLMYTYCPICQVETALLVEPMFLDEARV